MEVFSKALRYLGDVLLRFIHDTEVIEIEDTDIQWVLTVPTVVSRLHAHWGQQNKHIPKRRDVNTQIEYNLQTSSKLNQPKQCRYRSCTLASWLHPMLWLCRLQHTWGLLPCHSARWRFIITAQQWHIRFTIGRWSYLDQCEVRTTLHTSA